MNFPTVTHSLAERIDKAESDYMASKVTAAQGQAGNPFEVEVRRFGRVWAIKSKVIATPLFNRVLGVRPGDENAIPDILEWYRQDGLPFQVEIVPLLANSALLRSLANQGLYQSGFHAALYGVPDLDAPWNEDNGVSVEKVGASGMAEFAETYVEGFEIAGPHSPDRESSVNRVMQEYSQPGWTCYIARMGGEPVAVGALFVMSGVASLAAAGTIPMFRGKGCQSALIAARMAEAARLGCDLVVGHAGIGTVSQRNMERAGLRIAYTKVCWTEIG